MRKDVAFISEGLKCKGWFYIPDGLKEGKKAPVIVMAHGFSAVKEMYLSKYADRFCKSGMAVLAFDYRFLGESEGEPRGQVIPYTQIDDYRNAITWASEQKEVDSNRIGVWGTSYSGGHVLHLSAFDRRIKAVVAQVPNICAWKSILKGHGKDALNIFLTMVNMDRAASLHNKTPNYIPVVAPEGQPAALGTPDAYEFFIRTGEQEKSTWLNKVTMESLEKLVENDPADAIEIISPTPLLIVAAEKDSLIPVEVVKEAFGRAKDPKRLVVIPCGHFDVYDTEPWHFQAVDAAAGWFVEHLIQLSN
jgi:fermentation-respiration switch protein FrsA (DUF1100 family)